MFTYDQLYRAYTETYTHTEIEKQEDGSVKSVTYRPECPANHKELDDILLALQLSVSLGERPFFTIAHVVNAMREIVGISCPAHCRPKY